jgi:hypothetical protein
MLMKFANVAHSGFRSGARAINHVPRGLVVIGAALSAWFIFAAVGAMIVQIFAMILAHF